MKRVVLLSFLLWCCLGLLSAQEGLHIDRVFGKYAVRENAVEVSMTGKPLKDYRLSQFHSLEVRHPQPHDIDYIERQLADDVAKATVHEEGRQGERLLYGFYELPSAKQHTYIFYRHTPEKVTLIFLQGRATVEEMKTFFKK